MLLVIHNQPADGQKEGRIMKDELRRKKVEQRIAAWHDLELPARTGR